MSKYIFDRYNNISNHWLWLSNALFAKGLVILFLMYNLDLFNNNGQIGICNGDCPDYLHTAQNLAQTGTFGKLVDGKVEPYAGRMIGYDAVLAPLSFFFDEFWAKNLTHILQIMLSAISTYFLAKTAYLIFHSKRVFYTVFFIYSINSLVTLYDLFILTESFCISALIISIYLIIADKNKWQYVLAGTLLTWAIFMRPYLLPLCALLNIYILYLYLLKKRENWRTFLKIVVAFNIVFSLVETIWITRNYIHFNKFIPLTTDVYAGLQEGRLLALMEFVQSWGGDIIFWNPKAEIILFYKLPQINHLEAKYVSFGDLPTYIFTSAYTADSLQKLKKIYDIAEDTLLPQNERHNADLQATAILRKYRNSFIIEKPFYFYVIAPLRLLPKFLLHSGSYNISNLPFVKQNIFQKFIKIFYSALYYFVLIGGFSFTFYIFFHFKKITFTHLIPLMIALYITLLFPIILRRIEYRYFITAYPYLTILACYMLGVCLDYIFKSKSYGIE